MTALDLSSMRLRRLLGAGVLAAGIAALLWGCGGGVGTGGTGDDTAYASSSVTGFGSVIVGGVEFDDSAASVLDDDGAPVSRNGNEVRLGMTLEAKGTGDVSTSAASTAASLRIVTAALGPVDAVDTAARTLSVLGQAIEVSGSTVFGPPLRGGLSAIAAGDVVAVYGFADASSGHVLATRIEKAQGARAYRLRGVVSALDTTAKTLHIGGATLDYANATNVPAALANGQLARVRLPAAGGAVLNVDAFIDAVDRPTDAHSAQVDGLVTSFASSGSFIVNGITVDASQASIEPASATLGAGLFVSVQGRLSGGTLVATQVQVQSAAAIDARVFRVSGTVSALDTAAKTFVVRNVQVGYSAAAFAGGTVQNLTNGSSVRVEGTMSADGSQINATQITIR